MYHFCFPPKIWSFYPRNRSPLLFYIKLYTRKKLSYRLNGVAQTLWLLCDHWSSIICQLLSVNPTYALCLHWWCVLMLASFHKQQPLMMYDVILDVALMVMLLAVHQLALVLVQQFDSMIHLFRTPNTLSWDPFP